VNARATDSSGNVSTSASVTVRFFNVPGAYEQRISPGNPSDVTNCDATVWVADRAHSLGSFGFSGGASGILVNAISGVCAGAQSLYQRERYSTPAASFRYLFDCPAGVYETTVHEAETWETGANARVFNLYIEEQEVVTNLDIFAQTGGMNIPMVMTFTNVCSDGQLELHFYPLVGNARASGIQVKRIGDSDSDGDGTPDWWMMGHFNHAAGQEADGSRAGDDVDGDYFTTQGEYVADTVPTNGDSHLRVETVALVSGPSVQFMSSNARLYGLEAGEDLVGGSWTGLVTDMPGTGAAMTVNDTNGVMRRYYRVSVRIP
jgi:hypothetical protein